jgi:NADPH2:quinone reductase
VRIQKTGGPEVLGWEDIPLGDPAQGELRVRHTAIGVNYIDVYHRTGAYPLTLPSGLGVEGAGTVVAVGPGVTGFQPGDRVAYAGGPPGAYAEERMVPAARALKLPAGVSDEVAASLTFKGLTVEYLIRRCYPVKRGDAVLLHAAAGGIGSIACQWLRDIGATVIGTVDSEEKAAYAKENGCDHPIVYKQTDVVQRVRELTNGQGVSVVYDSVGKDTFSQSLQALRPRGTLVSFGTISGPTPLIDLAELGAKGSLVVTRPSIAHYTAKREELEAGAAAVFEMIASGKIKPAKITKYPIREVIRAHADLESGKTSGSVILVP